jgi:hypothetical protein
MIRLFFLLTFCVLLSLGSIWLLAQEVSFGQKAYRADALVEDFISSRGKGAATISFETENGIVKAHLQTFYYPLEAGKRVSVLYLPDEPRIVELDSFYQRFLLPVSCLLFFVIFGLVAMRSIKKDLSQTRTTEVKPEVPSGV